MPDMGCEVGPAPAILILCTERVAISRDAKVPRPKGENACLNLGAEADYAEARLSGTDNRSVLQLA